MQKKLKEIIDSYPEFSRETVYNIVSEFNVKTLEEKRNQNREEILESFTVFGNNKIYLFEKTVRKCKMLIISQKEDNVLFRYKESFKDSKMLEKNFSEVFEIFDDELRWNSVINIELSKKIKESDLSFIYIDFCIKKDFLEHFLIKNIMLYLSKESLIALDFAKALKEVEKYDIIMELPEIYLQNKDFFNYGTMFSMLNEKTEFKKTGKYKKLPLSLLPAALFCNSPQDLEFIFDDMIKNKGMYLNADPVFFFSLIYWGDFVMPFLKANKITERWNIFPEKYFDEDETENKEKIDVIYDIFNILDELEEKDAIKKLVNKKSFESVEKMKEQLSKKLLAQKMKTVKSQKFKINAEFEEVEKALKKHFPSIEMINEERSLFLEGFEQKNCVYSYYKEKIKNNEEIIFSLKVKKEDNESHLKIPDGRYTISIKKNKDITDYYFKVMEVKKTANIFDEDVKIIFEKISEIIGELNQKIVKEKNEKFNCFMKNIEEFSGKEKIVNFFNAIKTNINPFESKDNFLVFAEFNSTKKIEAEVLKDKININFFLKIFLELSEKDKQNSKKDFEEEIQISFSLKKDGEAFFSIEKICCSYSEKLFSSMINFIFDFFSDKKMMKDIKIIFEEMEEEKKKENLFISLPIPAISYKELINYDSFVSYILSRKEIEKTNFNRKDIENLMNDRYAKFFIYHFLFISSEINETAEEKIKLKAEFLEKYLKYPENFKQLLRDFCGFPLTLAELERQYFEVSGKLEEMGISFKDKDEVNRTYFEELIENIQENSKNIREQNIDLEHLEFSFEGFENENKELFIENLISKPYRIYEATKNFKKTEQFEALNKDLAFLINKELLEQAQNIPLENSGTVTEFLENFKDEEAELLKIITTEKEYVENCLILNIEPEIERANKVENIFSIWQIKNTKIKVMLESSLKSDEKKIDFNLRNREGIYYYDLISSFRNESKKFFLEKKVLSKTKGKDGVEFEIPEWFEIYVKRHVVDHIVARNSTILSYGSKKFNNDSYEKFKSGNFKNKLCSFGNDNFFEFSYDENGITDIIYTNINDAPYSLKEENSEILKDAQKFYKEIMEEMKEKETKNKN